MALNGRPWKWGEERDGRWLQTGIERGIERERQASIHAALDRLPVDVR